MMATSMHSEKKIEKIGEMLGFLCGQDMSSDSLWHSNANQNQVAGLKNVLQEKCIALEKFSGGLFTMYCY